MKRVRGRGQYGVLALAVVASGLGTRPMKRLSDSVGSALGDALWAVLVYLVIVLMLPRVRPTWAWLAATLVAVVVEVSQLWNVGWLNTVRHTTLGALAIGGTFSVGDLWCYLAGTVLVFLIERWRGIAEKPD